jgi:putative transposase
MPSRLRRHDEHGHIHFVTVSCCRRLQFFRHPTVRNSFIQAMIFVRQKHGIRWLGYVVMPEHVHLLVLPQVNARIEPTPISSVLHDLKGAAGRLGKAALRDVWRRDRSLGTPPLDAWAFGNGPKPFWKPRGYDFNVTSEDKVLEKLQYIHANPIRRGLVENPEEWPWSSYRFYELGDDSLISMDWDGGFPILV